MRFQDREPQAVKGFRPMPAILCAVDADQEHSVGNLIRGGPGGITKTLNSAFHEITSFPLRGM